MFGGKKENKDFLKRNMSQLLSRNIHISYILVSLLQDT